MIESENFIQKEIFRERIHADMDTFVFQDTPVNELTDEALLNKKRCRMRCDLCGLLCKEGREIIKRGLICKKV